MKLHITKQDVIDILNNNYNLPSSTEYVWEEFNTPTEPLINEKRLADAFYTLLYAYDEGSIPASHNKIRMIELLRCLSPANYGLAEAKALIEHPKELMEYLNINQCFPRQINTDYSGGEFNIR